MMKIKEIPLEGAKILCPKVHVDRRGAFFELFRAAACRQAGIPEAFVQDNCSLSQRKTLRGMHFQKGQKQAKLVTVLLGEIFDVIVDLRSDLPSFGKWAGVTLNDRSRKQLYIPPYCAHGFCVLSEAALVLYKVSAYYDPAEERTFRFDDPFVGIAWPFKKPLLSDRDQNAPSLHEAVSC